MKYLKRWQIFERKSIKDTESYRNGEYHQVIMDIAFEKWQTNMRGGESEDLRAGTTDWTYADVIEFMGKYGPEFQLLILVGKYNQQVGNGGHAQYYDNGFASTGPGGFGSTKGDIQLHLDMLELMETTGLVNRDPVCKEAFEVMDKFRFEMQDYDEDCDECDNGTIEEECDECDGEEECDECDDGIINRSCDECDNGFVSPNVSYLDDEYYKVDDKFLEICNKYAKEVLDRT